MKNLTELQSLHPRFWTKEQEAIVNLLVKRRKKNKSLYEVFTKAARLTNHSTQAVAFRYYNKLRNADIQPAVPVYVQRKTTVVRGKTDSTNMSKDNLQLVSFVRTLFTRLTPAERADVIKNLV